MKNVIGVSPRAHIIIQYFAAQCDKACARGMAARTATEAERAEFELTTAVRNLCSAISTVAGHAITRSRS